MTVKAAQFLRDRLNQKPKHILNDMLHNRCAYCGTQVSRMKKVKEGPKTFFF